MGVSLEWLENDDVGMEVANRTRLKLLGRCWNGLG